MLNQDLLGKNSVLCPQKRAYYTAHNEEDTHCDTHRMLELIGVQRYAHLTIQHVLQNNPHCTYHNTFA